MIKQVFPQIYKNTSNVGGKSFETNDSKNGECYALSLKCSCCFTMTFGIQSCSVKFIFASQSRA